LNTSMRYTIAVLLLPLAFICYITVLILDVVDLVRFGKCDLEQAGWDCKYNGTCCKRGAK